MNKRIRNKLVAVLASGVLLLTHRSAAHNKIVHELITANAVSSAVSYSSGYSNFLYVINPGAGILILTSVGGGGATPARWMIIGSAQEDNVYADQNHVTDVGGARPFNHFYNPLNGQGLSDHPLRLSFLPLIYGQSSFVWGSVTNCPGIDVRFYGNVGKSNIWSWPNTRAYEMAGLTNSSPADRSAGLAQMFRGLGQVIHLLEDTSQPQHVRNEQHLDKIPLTSFNSIWHSAIEDYGSAHAYQLNYSNSLLDWRRAGFKRLQDFWDRGLYTSNNTSAQNSGVLNNDASSGDQLGLAEFSSANFLGDTASYKELVSPSGPHYFPFPSLLTSTDFRRRFNTIASNIDLLAYPDGTPRQSIYFRKTGDGVTFRHHSRLSYLGTINYTAGKSATVIDTTTSDDNVLQDYHSILIPKAVKYSAGMIDYFFRGTLATYPTNANDGSYHVTVTNTSSQGLSLGAFHLYYDDDGETRTELTGGDFSSGYGSALSSGDTITMTFNGNTNAVQYVLVYQGTIGTSGGTNSDPVDAGVGIAVTSFTVPTVDTNLMDGSVSNEYTAEIMTTGFSSPSFELADGSSLPDDLSMDDEGNIRGTPNSAGTFYFTVIITDEDTGFIYTQDLSITIDSDGGGGCPCEPGCCDTCCT